MSGGPVVLGPTGPEDTDAVLAMEAGPDTRGWLGDTGPGWHADARAAADVEHLTARCDGVLVGFVVLAHPRGGETGTELRRIVVAAGHRGRGHGRAILRAVVDRAGGRVWLDVKPDNRRARALYESEGFVVERELPADPRDPDAPVALVVMGRDYSAGSSENPS